MCQQTVTFDWFQTSRSICQRPTYHPHGVNNRLWSQHLSKAYAAGTALKWPDKLVPFLLVKRITYSIENHEIRETFQCRTLINPSGTVSSSWRWRVPPVTRPDHQASPLLKLICPNIQRDCPTMMMHCPIGRVQSILCLRQANQRPPRPRRKVGKIRLLPAVLHPAIFPA